MFRSVAVAYEEHPEGVKAFRRALELAKLLEVPLTVLAIAEPLPAYTAFSAAADTVAMQILEQDRTGFYERVTSRLTDEGHATGVAISAHILDGETVHAIVDFVERKGIDLLVVGLHRHTLRVSSLWSTVYSLSQALSCSILGVH